MRLFFFVAQLFSYKTFPLYAKRTYYLALNIKYTTTGGRVSSNAKTDSNNSERHKQQQKNPCLWATQINSKWTRCTWSGRQHLTKAIRQQTHTTEAGIVVAAVFRIITRILAGHKRMVVHRWIHWITFSDASLPECTHSTIYLYICTMYSVYEWAKYHIFAYEILYFSHRNCARHSRDACQIALGSRLPAGGNTHLVLVPPLHFHCNNHIADVIMDTVVSGWKRTLTHHDCHTGAWALRQQQQQA